ncbi:hypothetical protein [Phocaeicola salanitronis]|uniref:hypothetical protein n=1 Tax=Phocaeicola salanitronis TaxID=376805 RepID=UPI0023F79974|nr:hypothetical protein [Phocaeicola salanitronis]
MPQLLAAIRLITEHYEKKMAAYAHANPFLAEKARSNMECWKREVARLMGLL